MSGDFDHGLHGLTAVAPLKRAGGTMPDRIRKTDETDLTPEQRARLEAFRASRHTPEVRDEEKRVRERFQRDKPTLEELVASGEYEGPYRHGDVMAFLTAIAHLKRERERRSLSLADVSRRSGLDTAMLSRLENGKIMNPTITTLWRYAEAIGTRIVLAIEDQPMASCDAARR